MLRKLKWAHFPDEKSTHFVKDGTCFYYTSATGQSVKDVAKSFAATYDHNGCSGTVTAFISFYDHETESYSKGHQFSFDEQRHFEY